MYGPFKRENDDQPSNLGRFPPNFFKENHIYQHSQHSWSCSTFCSRYTLIYPHIDSINTSRHATSDCSPEATAMKSPVDRVTDMGMEASWRVGAPHSVYLFKWRIP